MNTRRSELTPERVLLRLDWQVIRRLDGLLQGDYRMLFYGYGVDFADLREYQPGDDIRGIDRLFRSHVVLDVSTNLSPKPVLFLVEEVVRDAGVDVQT